MQWAIFLPRYATANHAFDFEDKVECKPTPGGKLTCICTSIMLKKMSALDTGASYVSPLVQEVYDPALCVKTFSSPVIKINLS